MQTIDTCGLLCPAPLIKTKKALLTATDNEEFLIICDQETAFQNLNNYLHELGFAPKLEQNGTLYKLSFVNTPNVKSKNLAVETFCTPVNTPKVQNLSLAVDTQTVKANSSYVVVINSLCMGKGDADLGNLLLKAYINTLAEVEALPSCIIFYNEGVRLTLHNSEVLEALQNLQSKGIKILSCGTCLDFYQLKTDLAVGEISNMYTIAEVLSKAAYIVYP
ncbi:MAG: sulfurtransferase-like selenium metabolism protein YedF [Bacteroidales bacterium]